MKTRTVKAEKVNVKISGVVIEAEGDAIPAAMKAFGELLASLLPKPADDDGETDDQGAQ